MSRFLVKALPCLLLVLLALLGQAGCAGNPEDHDAKIQKLSQNLSSQLQTLSEQLEKPLSNNDPKAAEKVLASFFLKASQAGKPLDNGVLLLNAQGVTFAERNPAPGHPDGVSTRRSARDYSSYKIIRQCFEKSCTLTGVVYLNQEKLYVVCHPMGGRKPIGILVLGILGSYLEAKIGVSGQEFLDMEISP
jgi:outer membrane murein-binding lipoprotein Lpp